MLIITIMAPIREQIILEDQLTFLSSVYKHFAYSCPSFLEAYK